MPPGYSKIAPILFAALIVFAIYRRLRRTFGRQPLSPRRMTFRIVLLTLVGCSLLPLSLKSGAFLWAMIGGLAGGTSLGWYGSDRTRFVTDAGRRYYLPHTYTGIAVSLLFLGRLVYRLAQVYVGGHAGNPAAPEPGGVFGANHMVSSPLTVGLFFVLVGYYVCYYSRVLWKSGHPNPDDIETAASIAPP